MPTQKQLDEFRDNFLASYKSSSGESQAEFIKSNYKDKKQEDFLIRALYFFNEEIKSKEEFTIENIINDSKYNREVKKDDRYIVKDEKVDQKKQPLFTEDDVESETHNIQSNLEEILHEENDDLYEKNNVHLKDFLDGVNNMEKKLLTGLLKVTKTKNLNYEDDDEDEFIDQKKFSANEQMRVLANEYKENKKQAEDELSQVDSDNLNKDIKDNSNELDFLNEKNIKTTVAGKKAKKNITDELEDEDDDFKDEKQFLQEKHMRILRNEYKESKVKENEFSEMDDDTLRKKFQEIQSKFKADPQVSPEERYEFYNRVQSSGDQFIKEFCKSAIDNQKPIESFMELVGHLNEKADKEKIYSSSLPDEAEKNISKKKNLQQKEFTNNGREVLNILKDASKNFFQAIKRGDKNPLSKIEDGLKNVDSNIKKTKKNFINYNMTTDKTDSKSNSLWTLVKKIFSHLKTLKTQKLYKNAYTMIKNSAKEEKNKDIPSPNKPRL